MGEFEILEHTADIGVRARGASLEEIFEQATMGLLDVAGIWQPRDEETAAVEIEVEADDLDALLVEWLSEVLYLHDARTAAIADLQVSGVDRRRAAGKIALAPFDPERSQGTQVKAVTYHQLRVEETAEGWTAQVFFDV